MTYLAKTHHYAHYVKEQFSLSMVSSINKLTTSIHHCQMLMGLLLLRLVSEACQMSTSAQVSIDATGWLVQATTLSLLEITTQLVDDINYVGHGFSYVL